jgi:hypothetical protein
VSVRNAAVSTSLLLLLAISTGCAGEETDTKPSSNTRPRKVVDAGPQCAPFNAAYRDDFKACEVDADCEVAVVESGCKGKLGVYGVATAQREEFNECVPDVDSLPACVGGQDPVRAEDKRVAAEPDLANVDARCVEGSCQTRITEQPCGSLTCTRFQLCVSFLTAGLPQFTCVANPCGNKPLDCECAEDVCVAAGEGVHVCQAGQVENTDVFCKLEKR